jgi:hypothetical protein
VAVAVGAGEGLGVAWRPKGALRTHPASSPAISQPAASHNRMIRGRFIGQDDITG